MKRALPILAALLIAQPAEAGLLSIFRKEKKTEGCPSDFGALFSGNPFAAPKFDWPTTMEWKIPGAQIAKARQQVDKDFLNSSYFLVPNNDGEAKRAVEMLEALQAPHRKVSPQAWGAELGKEPGLPSPQDLQRKGIKRIVTFEMPGADLEEAYRKAGIEVVVIDHHSYPGLKLNRHKNESSLEQLMKLLNWPASRTDLALAVNDRSYIPGLKAQGLTEEEIGAIRRYDIMAQGKPEREIDDAVKQARDYIPKIEKVDGIYFVENSPVDESYLKQELALKSPNGIVSTYLSSPGKISFSGNPKVAELLLNYDFTKHGYHPGKFDQYGGGDKSASMFFGFKPKEIPDGFRDPLPKEIEAAVKNDIKRVLKGENPLEVAKNPTPARKLASAGQGTASREGVPASGKFYYEVDGKVHEGDYARHGKRGINDSDDREWVTRDLRTNKLIYSSEDHVSGGFKHEFSPSPADQAKLRDRFEAQARGGSMASTGSQPVSASKALNHTVAAEPINPAVKAAKMLPRGSALATSSGDLEKSGIRQIIHAATGSSTMDGPDFTPTLAGVTDSVKNSLALARANGHKRVALPFLGGKIFVDRIGVAPQALADAIVEKAIKERNGLEIRFVTFGDEDTRLFQNAVAKYRGSLTDSDVSVLSGSLTNAKLHGASAIVNAANMEVQFGGGLSGVIGEASGQAERINEEARQAIEAIYK